MNQMNQIKAIDTSYKGYKLRSRLEARWACFFDALGIKWEYEPEGYVLSNGKWYLPDFWLPKFHGPEGLWVEVKPSGDDFDVARLFAESSGKSILLLDGTPDYKEYYIAGKYDSDKVHDIDAIFYERYICGSNADEYRMYVAPGCDIKKERDNGLDLLGQAVQDAIEFARSARFEHGQTPSFR